MKKKIFLLLKLDSLIEKFTSITAFDKLIMHGTYEAIILQHHQIQSSKGASQGREWLQFCWDFVKPPRNDEIALQHFFFFLIAVKEFFSIIFVLHAIFFFRQALVGNCFFQTFECRALRCEHAMQFDWPID